MVTLFNKSLPSIVWSVATLALKVAFFSTHLYSGSTVTDTPLAVLVPVVFRA